MKKLSDSELKEFAVSLLDKQGLEQYEQYIQKHEQKLKQDCEYNGFYNVPEECEGSECGDCMLVEYDRRAVDCPYLE